MKDPESEIDFIAPPSGLGQGGQLRQGGPPNAVQRMRDEGDAERLVEFIFDAFEDRSPLGGGSEPYAALGLDAFDTLCDVDQVRAIEVFSSLVGRATNLERSSLVESLARLEQADVAKLIVQAARGGDESLRDKATRRLVGREHPAARDWLLRAVADESLLVRYEATQALLASGGQAAAAAFAAGLASRDKRVRLDSGRALVELGDPKGLEALQEWAESTGGGEGRKARRLAKRLARRQGKQ